VECDLEPAEPGTVPVDPACDALAGEVVVDPWNLTIEWQWTVDATESGVIVMPAIGNLTDDDGDGQITANDDPEVAFTTWGGASRLVVLDSDGTERFTVPGANGQAGVTIADVTGDGWPEVIALTAGGQVVAVDGTGAVLWIADPLVLSFYPQPTVADLDNNGVAEVIFDTAILDGPTGQWLATITGVATSWRTPAVADLDLDGTREIVLGEIVARPDGTTKWSMGGGYGYGGNFAAIADIDGDPEGEVLSVSGSTLSAFDSDGTLLGSTLTAGFNAGPPSVADFDGDGEVEIAVPAGSILAVYETTGQLVWSMPIQDNSGLAGCSGYDVDGDGAYEVLYADETDLRIYDGRTGTVWYQNGSHDSATVWEYPVTADVDNDGSAEIAIASNFGEYRGVTVFGHAGAGWSKSGPTWGTHDFAVTNLLADGSVPSNETPSWQVHNTFRARPTVDDPGQPDPHLSIGEPCWTGCGADDTFELPWQVDNAGGAALPAGAEVHLLAVTSGAEVELASTVLPAVAPGELLPGGVFTVAASDLAGADQYRVRLDGWTLDCHPGDTELERPTPCP
ncbi:MAG: VCBS repeat-containing protein, partial [Myxococcota bacterium]